MFHNCKNLTSVTIPESVTWIGYQAFNGCTKLTDVYYAGSESSWNFIDIDNVGNDYLNKAEKHYNSTGPVEKPVSTDPATGKTKTAITVEVNGGKAVTYTGKTVQPTVVVRDAEGSVIDRSEYSIVGYKNNTNIASADSADAPSVTVKAKAGGSYIFTNADENGEVTQTFTIEGVKVTVSAKDITTTYTGTDVTQDKKVISKIKGTAKAGKKTVKGTWSFVDTGIVNASDEPYDVTVQFTPDDKNYEAATTTIKVTVKPAKISVKSVLMEPDSVSEMTTPHAEEVLFKGLLGNDKLYKDFDYVVEFPNGYKKIAAGTQSVSYKITLLNPNYTFGSKNYKTGTVKVKISAD
jgi:hypothetical protein